MKSEAPPSAGTRFFHLLHPRAPGNGSGRENASGLKRAWLPRGKHHFLNGLVNSTQILFFLLRHSLSLGEAKSSMSESKYITLVSGDGFEFVVLREAALRSKVIKSMLDSRSMSPFPLLSPLLP